MSGRARGADGPLPLALGGNTAYALRLADGGALLVDAGPDIPGASGEDSWRLAAAQLAAGGFAPSGVRAVLVTHWHADHSGLARRWAEAGARILAGEADAPALAAGQAWSEARIGARARAFAEHGCPPALAARLGSPARRRPPEHRWEPCPREAVEAVADGAEFELADGSALRVVAAPGHTPGNLAAFAGAAGDLYSGDTLLPDTAPSPGLHFPGGGDGGPGERWPSLPPFVASVERLRGLGARRVLPGHGAPAAGEAAARLFDRFGRRQARRRAQVRALLAERADTAYGVARRLFPRLPEPRLAQAMTEVIGQLDVLAARGEAVAVRRGGVLTHRLAETR